MSAERYLDSQEPAESGSLTPDAEAPGTDWPTGRTGSTNPSRPAAADASTPHFKLTYVDPPAELSQHVLTLFYFAYDQPELLDRHPGALGQLFLASRGIGTVEFPGQTDTFGPGAHLFSGFETARPFNVEGPWHVVGASLSALGWAALTGAPANAHINRVLPAAELLGADVDAFASELNTRYLSQSLTGEAACMELSDWIAARLSPVNKAHESLIDRVVGWLGTSLNPDVEALFETLKYSRRQAERLVTRYFGLAPAALARKFRAIRAANLLAQPGLSDEAESEIASAFYDQPHMIREIRRYTGYTPTRLGGDKEPVFQTLLRLRNLDRLEQFRVIGENRDSA